MDQPEPTHPPLVVIGGSAGAIEPLRTVLGGLRGEFPAAVCVVIHLPEDAPSALPVLLARTGPLPDEYCVTCRWSHHVDEFRNFSPRPALA